MWTDPCAVSCRKAAALALLLFGLPACSDFHPTAGTPPTHSPPDQTLQAMICEASVVEKSVRCAPEAGAEAGAISATIIGGQNTNVRLASSNVDYDAEDWIFQFDVTVQNLLPERMGTADGVTLHSDGVRVFFSSGPTPTAGSGTATVDNPDGVSVFTASDQPYFQYDEILDTDEVSSEKTWRLRIEPTVTTFTFAVFVAAPLQPLIVINEIMANPAGAVQDSAGEYVELYNAGRWPVNLDGFVVADAESSHTIADSVVIPGGGYALSARDPQGARFGLVGPRTSASD